MIAAGRHERGGAEVGLQLEAEHVAVEARAPSSMSPTCRCRWPIRSPSPTCVARLLAVDRRQQRRRSPAAPGRRRSRGPRGHSLARPVGGELDAVAVGVGQVDRLVGAVVRGALDRRARRRQADGGAGELLAAGVQQRVVVEAGVAARRAGLRVLVQHDDGLGAVAELGRRGVVAVHAQAERPLVPGDGAVDVGDGQLDGAEAQRGGQCRHAAQDGVSVRLRGCTSATLYQHGFARVAACTGHVAVADPPANAERVLRLARACARGRRRGGACSPSCA